MFQKCVQDSLTKFKFLFYAPRAPKTVLRFLLLVTIGGGIGSASADRVLLFDSLNQKTTGTQTGGKFVAGGGWTLLNNGDRIVWKIPDMGPNGMAEFDVVNLDPPNQALPQKWNLFGLWGTLFNNYENQNKPNTDSYDMRLGTSEVQFKLEYHSEGLGTAVRWEPISKFDPKHVYHFKIVWRNGIVTTTIDDLPPYVKNQWTPLPIDRFNFMHVGTEPVFGASCCVGPVFSNFKLTELGTVGVVMPGPLNQSASASVEPMNNGKGKHGRNILMNSKSISNPAAPLDRTSRDLLGRNRLSVNSKSGLLVKAQ